MMDADTVLLSIRESIEERDPELAATLYTLEDYYERKLWYQLTDVLKNSVFKNSAAVDIRLKLFENFVMSFSNKINQLQLVEFLVLSLVESSATEALEYLTNLKLKMKELADNKNKKSTETDINEHEVIQALIYLENELAKVKLELGFADEASSMIDKTEREIDQLSFSVDSRVNASFYNTRAQLMKSKADFNGFYYNSLLCLACIPDLKGLEHQDSIVTDICISGILGDKIYNFGEIIMHDIFQYLKNDWLKELVLCLNNGDLATFQRLVKDTAKLNNIAELSSRADFLEQKVCIMAFIELIFNRPSTNRHIQFSEISEKIPLLNTNDKIEFLIMKCLSLGLMKGTINEIGETVEVSWIQPRTMTHKQIEHMKERVSLWTEQVSGLHEYMSSCGGELYA